MFRFMLALGAACCLAAAASADPIDWDLLADVPVIEILTTDPDGDLRETKVWFVVIDDGTYLRTRNSRWLDNIRQDPDVAVRVEGALAPVRAEELSDPAWVERVDQASLEKYGWQQRAVRVFRMGTPQILRLLPREESSAN